MSRVAKMPILIPSGVEVKIDDRTIFIKGKNGELVYTISPSVIINCLENNTLTFSVNKGYSDAWAQAGTARALINNMIDGVTGGFIKKLQLVGVGYRAVINKNTISLLLGFSHSVNYVLPDGITAECFGQTEIVLKGFDKQLLGQVAANIKAYRFPEPYKGKGIRYINEIIRIKSAKKK